jgi:ATP-binding cassette subfamily B protein IrtA
MTTPDLAEAGEQSTPPSDGCSTAGQSMARLLRPYLGSFAAVVILQVIGAIAGLAPPAARRW